MAVTFSPLVTITPVLGTETTVATIVGGPFDKVDAFIRGGGGGSGFLRFRLYATVGGLTSVVSEAVYQGNPSAPSRGALLMWTLPSNSGVMPPSDPVRQPNDPTTNFSVHAGGTAYKLTVEPLPRQGRFTAATPPASFPLLPFDATLAGVNEFDVAPDNNTSLAVALPPTSAEVNAGLAAGYAQNADVAANMTGIPNLLFSLYASCGAGSVEAKVYTIEVPGGGGIKNIFRDIDLPVATAYRLTVRKVNADGVAGPGVVVSFATYSIMATAGGAVILGGDVTGPSAANTVVKWENVPLDPVTMAAPAATSIPEFVGGFWKAVPLAVLIGGATIAGDVTGTLAASKVVAWENKPLDPVTMGAPAVGNVPTWNGVAWVAAPGGGAVVLGGDVIGPSGANRVIAWNNVPLDLATMAAPVASAIPMFDGARWAASTGDITRSGLGANVVSAWEGKPLDPITMAAPNAGDVPEWDGAKWIATPGGGAVLLGGDVTGPAGANTVVRWENIQLDPATMGAPAAGSIPQLVGGQWHAVAVGGLGITGDVVGTLAASKVIAWENVPLDPASMGAPAANSIPEFIGGQWRAVLASGLTIAGDVTGTLAASTVVRWEGQPLDPATMAAPAVGNVPTWDGAKWIAAPGGGAVVLAGDVTGPSGANTVVRWQNRPLDPATMGTPADGTIPIYDLGLNQWRAVLINTDASLTNTGSLVVTGWEAIALDGTMAAPVVGDVPIFNVDGTWHAGVPGGAVILGGDVTGPSGANTVVRWENIPLDAVTMGAPTKGQIPIFDDISGKWRAEGISQDALLTPAGVLTVTGWQTKPVDPATMGAPNLGDVPTWDGAKWIAAPGGGAVVLGGDVTGPSGANTVVRWENQPLDPVTMGAPVLGQVPQWDGAKWIAVGLSALGIAGDVTGTLAASKVVAWDNVPLLTGAGAGSFDLGSLPNAGIPIFDGASGHWRSFALSGGATMTPAGVVTISPAGLTLTGNVNGPANANRFLALTLEGLDADVNVVNTSGWTNVRMRSLTADRTVNLPAAPQNGEYVVVKDGTGSLANFNIFINGGGNPIDEVAGPYQMTGQQNGIKGSIAVYFDAAAPAGWYIV